MKDPLNCILLYHEGFESERRDRIAKAGGGLLCFIQNDKTYEKRTDLENPTIGMIWLEIKFATSKNILVGFFYRPPNSNSEWLNTFDKDIDLIPGNFNEIILMGDMNIDLANHKDKTHVPSNAKKLLNILDSCNLTQIITSFTRISSTSKTLIDHAYVNNNKEIIQIARLCN